MRPCRAGDLEPPGDLPLDLVGGQLRELAAQGVEQAANHCRAAARVHRNAGLVALARGLSHHLLIEELIEHPRRHPIIHDLPRLAGDSAEVHLKDLDLDRLPANQGQHVLLRPAGPGEQYSPRGKGRGPGHKPPRGVTPVHRHSVAEPASPCRVPGRFDSFALLLRRAASSCCYAGLCYADPASGHLVAVSGAGRCPSAASSPTQRL